MQLRDSDIDGVLSRDGQIVYSNSFAERLRAENLEKIKRGEPIRKIIPQAGFQEEVLTNNADVLIIGGRRGGGKSLCMLLVPIPFINNPLFKAYAFRKEEDDLKRGLWSTSEKIYTKFATPTALKWTYPSGATMDMEHMQNEAKIDQRYRGAELPCILIDELPQISHTTFFTLLASNRNTIGVRNRFVSSCNPTNKKHWVYKFIRWYIDEETHSIDQGRSGKIRYFFKPSENIEDVVWGNTKEEVYLKAKDRIDGLIDLDSGETYESFITSFSFIEGLYSENKIFRVLDKSYKAKLAAKGGIQATKDINGTWGDDEAGTAQISQEDIETYWLNNTEQRGGKLKCTIDVALLRDYFVMYAWKGRHLFDVEYFTGTGSITTVDFVKKFLQKHSIREESMAFDTNGIGVFMQEHFPKAIPFNSRCSASNPKMWDNLKSECADKFIDNIKAGKYSVSASVRNRNILVIQKEFSREKRKGDYSITWEDRILDESRALQRKETDNGRFEIITKAVMKDTIGHSPDFLEAAFMVEAIPDTVSCFSNLGMLVGI